MKTQTQNSAIVFSTSVLNEAGKELNDMDLDSVSGGTAYLPPRSPNAYPHMHDNAKGKVKPHHCC